MEGAQGIAIWISLRAALEGAGLAHAEHALDLPAPPAPPIDGLERALSPQYRAFVGAVGHRAIAFAPRDLVSFALLPPAWIAHASRELSGARAFFAAWDLAAVDGWAFDVEGRVWFVEARVAVEAVGTFDEWLARRAAEIVAWIEERDEGELEALRRAPHRPTFGGP